MLELKADQFHIMLPLLDKMEYGGFCPNSVIEGNHPGRIFVDKPIEPEIGFVWCRGGFYCLAGNENNEGFNQSLMDLLFDKLDHHTFWLYPYPVSSWERKLDSLLGDRVTKMSFRSFRFNPSEFQKLLPWRDKIPSGFEVKRIDEKLMSRIGEIRGLTRRFWKSTEDFMKIGFGFCLLHRGEIVTFCYSAFVGGGKYEIDIRTVEKYRRQGFGEFNACAFIEHCLNKNKIPSWHCGSTNVPSDALARKLGFEPKVDFPIYRWIEAN